MPRKSDNPSWTMINGKVEKLDSLSRIEFYTDTSATSIQKKFNKLRAKHGVVEEMEVDGLVFHFTDPPEKNEEGEEAKERSRHLLNGHERSQHGIWR